MAKQVQLLLLALFLFPMVTLHAQDEEAPKVQQGWNTGAGIGLDFAQLLQINPRQGAGQNRLGFGGALNVFGQYRKDRVAWDNRVNWQFGIQKLGSGPLPSGEDIPFQKSIDELRINSKLGYSTSTDSKFFYAVDFSLLTQFTPTYQGTPEYPGNFLSDITENEIGTLLSRFFNPATINISVGIDYQPTEQLSLYYSPIGGKFITVPDDEIAALGVHGNPVTRDEDGNVIAFENTDSQLGSLLRVAYADNYLEDKITITSGLSLYSNYLNNPQNIDVDWNNELAATLLKNLQAVVTINVFYDDDVLVQITDFDAPNGVSGLGKRVSLTQQLLLKYNVTF